MGIVNQTITGGHHLIWCIGDITPGGWLKFHLNITQQKGNMDMTSNRYDWRWCSNPQNGIFTNSNQKWGFIGFTQRKWMGLKTEDAPKRQFRYKHIMEFCSMEFWIPCFQTNHIWVFFFVRASYHVGPPRSVGNN